MCIHFFLSFLKFVCDNSCRQTQMYTRFCRVCSIKRIKTDMPSHLMDVDDGIVARLVVVLQNGAE